MSERGRGESLRALGKALGAALKKLFTTNLLLKGAALLFAVVLWCIVLTKTNPAREKTLYDIPVQIAGVEALNARGLAVKQDLSEMIQTVDVHLSVRQNDLKSVTRNNVQVVLDVSHLYYKGEHTVTLGCTTAYGSLLSLSESSVVLDVDSLVSSAVPVSVRAEGELQQGYLLYELYASPESVTVTGAETDVASIASAEAVISLSGLTEQTRLAVGYTLLDAEGNAVEGANLQLENGPAVTVVANVYPIRTVPVDTENSLSGAVAEGFLLKAVDVSEERVRIAAPKAILDEIDKISLGVIQVSGRMESFSESVALVLPEGVVWAETEQLEVSVTIEEMRQEKEFAMVPVTVRNQVPGTLCTTSVTYVSVTVNAPLSQLRLFGREDMVVYVDLSNATGGTYSNLPLVLEIAGITGYTYEISPAQTSATLTPSD